MPPTGCGGASLWRCIPFSLHGLLASRKRLDHAYLYQTARLSGYGSVAQRVAYNPGRALSGAAKCSAGSQALSEEQLERLHYVESRLPQTCSGCGVKLQREDSEAPGFFQIPKKLLELPAEPEQQPGSEQALDESVQAIAPTDGSSPAVAQKATEAVGEDEGPGKAASYEEKLDAFESMLDGWMEPEEEDEVALRLQEAAFTSDAESHRAEKPLHILCTRCFSLTHYGKVKSQVAEQRMPRFDLSSSVGAKLKLVKYRLQVVLVVVDMVDFDGSLPRIALAQLLPDGMMGRTHEKVPPRELGFKLILALNKRDLLPASATAHRLKMWARQRSAEGGLPKPHTVHLVSAHTGAGVLPLLRDVHDSVGDRGDLYVVGAQNAGKSSLINAMRKLTRAPRSEDVTTASLPGTTLGLIEVAGLGLPSKCKAWDTPGVPHVFQLSTRLQPEEVKMLLPRSPLKPRTFRIPPGSTILVGGVARLDLVSCPGSSLYVTVWASSDIACHLGKTQGAQDRWLKFVGSQLLPPLGEAGVQAAGPLQPFDVEVEGDSWRESTRDIHVAGCGWFAIGVKGTARFTAWAHQGIAITTRMALLPDYAKTFERPGFGNKTRGAKGSTQKALAKSAGDRKNSSGRRR